MKRILSLIVISAVLACSTATFTSCSTMTREAAVYNTFKSTWIVSKTAYGAWCEKVVQGKVSADAEVEADNAWNKFRAVFTTSFKLANLNWDAPTDAQLIDAQNELLNLLRKLSI